jgi:uncharacterized OB-fold protein
MATKRPDRTLDPYAEQFWGFTSDRELRLQRCIDCGKYRWPPGPACDNCLSDGFQWTVLSGLATLLSWTTFHRGYFPEYPAPHTTIAVELAEGPLFVAYPVDIEAAELREGMSLQVVWVDAEDRFGEYNLPVFRLAE